MPIKLPSLKLKLRRQADDVQQKAPNGAKSFSWLRTIFSPEIRNRILFTIFIIAIYRLLASVPLPGVNMNVYQQQFGNESISEASYLLTVFTGGRLETPSIVGLGIGVFITASIIIQLLGSIIPRLDELTKEGNRGKQIIDQYTRYLTVPLSFVYALGYIYIISQPTLAGGTSSPISNLIPRNLDGSLPALRVLFMALVLTAGSMLLMWLGELITEKGIGNGSSILIMVSILASLPAFISKDIASLNIGEAIKQVLQGNTAFLTDPGLVSMYIIIGGALVLTLAIVFVSGSMRKIVIQYARRERSVGNITDSIMPIRLDQSGVLPIIFASALLSAPQLLVPVLEKVTDPASSFGQFAASLQNSFLFNHYTFTYQLVYFVLIVLLALMYSTISLKPDQLAENFQKSGGFIPGVRPGANTEKYITQVLLRMTFAGSIFLGLIALIPLIAGSGLQSITGYTFQLFSAIGGTSILIVVGVILDTLRQLKSLKATQSYDRFL